jgi:DNA-directed RNA polymerase specialized sigma24 family protein
MTPLLLALALQAAPLAPATPAVEAEPTVADTLAGLEETYRTTCGQTGILYHSYDDLCEALRKQIGAYRKRVEREAAAHKVATPPAPKS